MKVKAVMAAAKKTISTQTGKKVSDTAFKSFLKKDKNLKKYAYTEKSTTLKKHDAQKFIGQVASKAHGHEKFKLSRFAKKMGIKVGADGKASNIGVDKIYQKTSQEELKSMEPEGPSKQQVRMEKRREEAIKTMHKRERADETKKEMDQEAKKQNNEQSQSPSMRSPATPMQHGGTPGTQSTASNAQNDTGVQSAPLPASKGLSKEGTIKIAILPFTNLTPNIKRIDWLVSELFKSSTRTLNSQRVLTVANALEVKRLLNQKKFQEPNILNNEQLLEISTRLSVAFLIIGQVKKSGDRVEIVVKLFIGSQKTFITIATLNEDTEDVFELEKKMNWQIANFFKEKNGSNKDQINSDMPSPTEAIDLPI